MPSSSKARKQLSKKGGVTGGSWRFHSIAIVSICLLSACAYSNTLQGPFVWDDIPNIVENPQVRLTELKLSRLYETCFKNISPRPVAHLSFALNYYWGGYDVTGYHSVNIAIHLLNGILVYVLALKTYQQFFHKIRCGQPSPSGLTLGWLALFAAGIFIAHPLQTQAVTYLVQRMASLATLFYLLSLWLYLQGRLCESNPRRWLWWTGCVVSGAFAIGTKPIAVTLPLAILLYEWYFFQDLNRSWARRRLKVLTVMAITVGLVTLLFLGDSPWQTILAGYNRRDFTMTERVLTQFRVVVYYLGLVVLPLPSQLNLLHEVSTSQSLFDPTTTLLSLLTLVGLGGLAVYFARSERLISFGIVWFFLHLVVESSIIALEMIYEHRLYLPMFGISIAVPYLFYRLLGKHTFVVRLVTILLLIVLGYGTYVRNAAWRDVNTLCTDMISKNPVATRAYLARADNYGAAGQHNLAAADYAKAIEIEPDYPNTYFNRGTYYRNQQQMASALADFSKTIELDPTFQRAYMSRGDLYASQGKLELAVKDYTRSIELAPELALSYNNRGIAYGRLGRQKLAYEDFSQAIEFDDQNGQAYFNRGSFNRNLGKFKQAISDFTHSISLEPDVAGAYLGRGSSYESLGQDAEAIADYTRAIELGADGIPANKRLAMLLASSPDEKVRDGTQAIQYATRACELAAWKAPPCLEALAAAYAETGNFEKAIQWQSAAIELSAGRRLPAMHAVSDLYQSGKAYRKTGN